MPSEVLQLIFSYVHPGSVPSLALISRSWHLEARRHLLSHCAITSSSQARLLLQTLRDNPDLRDACRALTLSKGSVTKVVPGAKRGQMVRVEDAVEPDDLVLLVGALPGMQELHLRELAFATLRRRHVQFASALSHLHTLSICGSPGSGSFNLVTVGQVISSLPQLKHLALRHIHVHPSALEGISPPTFQLQSFALFSTRYLEPRHFRWLLRTTSHAESLRHLALDWNDSPRKINPVRYVVLRLTKLSLSTRIPGTVEAFVMHCPSLRDLTIKSSYPVDVRVFSNLETPLWSFVDRSSPGGGVSLSLLERVVRTRRPPFTRELSKVVVMAWKDDEEAALEKLRLACLAKGVAFAVATEAEDSEVVWIPEECVAPSANLLSSHD